MVRKIMKVFGKEIGGLHEAAFLLGFFAVLSQILAIFRDRLLAHNFGAGPTLDTYYAAFRIPDFIYVSIASFISITVLIPFLSKKIEEDKDGKSAYKFFNDVFSVFFFVVVVVSGIAFIFMPYLAKFMAPGFSEYQINELVKISRILLVSPILFGLSNNLIGAVTQLFKKFFVFAIAPVLYNAGIIFGIIFFYPKFGLEGLAYGVILGAFLHLLIQLPVVIAHGFFPKFSRNIGWNNIKDIVRVSLPRALTISSNQLSIIVLVAIASTIYAGSISVFNFSFNIQSVPLAIIGVSYSVAAFPTLVQLFTKGEKGNFVDHMVSAAKHIIFWSLPLSFLFIVLRAQIVRTALGSGSFSWNDTRLVAASLALFSVSVVAQGLILLFIRGYYAIGNTRKPLFINVGFSILTVALAFLLVNIYNNFALLRYFTESLLRVDDVSGNAVIMLPLAYTISSILNAVALWYLFQKDYSGDFSNRIKKTFFEIFSASVFMGFVVYKFLDIFDDIFDINTFWGIFIQGALSAIVGVAVGIAVLKGLGSTELEEITEALKHKFWKAKVIAPEKTEL